MLGGGGRKEKANNIDDMRVFPPVWYIFISAMWDACPTNQGRIQKLCGGGIEQCRSDRGEGKTTRGGGGATKSYCYSIKYRKIN